jgi:hypothetical protein
MNIYKWLFRASVGIGIVGCAYMLLTGCATIQSVISQQRVYAIAKLATFTSCVATAGEPKSAAHERWVAALTELEAMIAAKDWRTIRLGTALDKAGVAEMIGSEGKLVIAGGVALVDLFTAVIWQVDTAKYVESVATGSRDGINLALNDALVADKAPATMRYDRAALIGAMLRMEAEATRPNMKPTKR